MRVKIKNEIWALRINGKEEFRVLTINKRERNILNSIRKTLIYCGITEDKICLTNRIDRIKKILKRTPEQIEKQINTRKSLEYLNEVKA